MNTLRSLSPLVPLPWQPLFTVERSGLPEITVSGVVCVRTHPSLEEESYLVVGDEEAPLWSRSLLKPWQLLSRLPQLKSQYPNLSDEQLAVMMSSHNGETRQTELIESILKQGNLSIANLQCASMFPLSSAESCRVQQEGKSESALYHPCSGKHVAYLLTTAPEQQTNYLKPDQDVYQTLRDLLKFLLGLESDDPMFETVDGCGMPNIALSADEMAHLFLMLNRNITDSGKRAPEVQSAIGHWDELARLMKKYPEIIGGQKRLDTRLMQGILTDEFDEPLKIVAKEGADGLLGIGIGVCEKYPYGVGILIKLASGYESSYLEKVACHVLELLGLRTSPPIALNESRILKTRFHFRLQANMPAPQPGII